MTSSLRTMTPAALGTPDGARWRPPVRDVALAGAFMALTLAEGLVGGLGARPPVALVVAVLAMASLAWRRSFPVVVAAIVLGAVLFADPSGEFSVLLALVLVAFTVGAETDAPRSQMGLAVLVVPFVAGLASEGLQPSDLAAALVFLVGPWSVGTILRQRSAHAADALARAEQAERDRELRDAEAAAVERVRIARELHDIVSHSISVITIQTQAVRRRLRPDQQREATDLAAVETTAREAMTEMRRLLGVLRRDGGGHGDLSPQPGLHEVPRLVEDCRSPGRRIAYRVEGTAFSLPPGLDLAAYRIVQEGLTNALRHSGAARIDVLVHYTPSTVEITVEDDGRGGDPRGGGYGLVGIRERVELYDGTVTAEPRPGGGFRLAARLPVGERP